MANKLCFNCFKIKGDYEVCPYCGFRESAGAQQPFQLTPGTVLRRRYIMGTCIGIGGFGITYKALDTTLGLVVAIKEFYPAGLVNRGEGEINIGVFSGEKQGEFKRQLERFMEEARNMANFSKERDIVNVFDFFEENRTAYIIMEYVDAPLLDNELSNGRYTQEKAIPIMLAILNALIKVHQTGIIHKDISPDNIFVTGPDSIKLFDFGAAKFQGTKSERTASMVVKAGYTPPEQYSSKDELGVFTDIYAAGAVFYEMVTGEKPMDSPDRKHMLKDTLKRPRDFGIALDDWLERVILKAMALEPKLRFKSAEEFKKAIEDGKKVDLPEEVIRRHRIIKRALVAGAAAVALVAGGTVVLSQTVFSAKGKIDVAKLKSEELSLWLSAEDEKTGEELSRTLLESVESECPQLDVDIEVIAKKDYADRLSQAIKEDALPDVFCTDSIDAEDSDYCAELSTLLHTMDLPSYLYLEEMDQDQEGSVYSLPTALQAGTVYINEEKTEDLPEYIEMEELQKMGKKLGYADEKGVFKDFQDMDSKICWIAGDLSDMGKVEAVTVEAVPSTDFTAIPIVTDGKLAGHLENWYGVKKSGKENKEKASMVLLSLLLSDGAQSTAYMDNREGLPLNREILDTYQENKLTTYLAFIREYDLEDAQLYDGTDICSILREETGGEGK